VVFHTRLIQRYHARPLAHSGKVLRRIMANGSAWQTRFQGRTDKAGGSPYIENLRRGATSAGVKIAPEIENSSL
jgi:hypothetical protein